WMTETEAATLLPRRGVSGKQRDVPASAMWRDTSPASFWSVFIPAHDQLGVAARHQSFDVADYFGVSEEVIKRTYGHHDPEHHREVTARMDRRRLSAPVSRRASPLRQNGLFDEKPTV
ncbi:MAG: hypothetical protein WBD95_07055, partial [Xanthobacteraceae bacterium]